MYFDERDRIVIQRDQSIPYIPFTTSKKQEIKGKVPFLHVTLGDPAIPDLQGVQIFGE